MTKTLRRVIPPALRARAVQMHDEGMSYREIAPAFNVNVRTVQRWVERSRKRDAPPPEPEGEPVDRNDLLRRINADATLHRPSTNPHYTPALWDPPTIPPEYRPRLAKPDALAPVEVLADYLLQIEIRERPSRWVPGIATDVQRKFLLATEREVLYGGAIGGGKTWALLACALQFANVQGYRAIVFRRTFPALEKSILRYAKEWLLPHTKTGRITYNAQRYEFTFTDSGATLQFSHLQHEDSVHSIQGAEFQFIGFDELTEFSRSQYMDVQMRLRKRVDSPVPLRIRATSNPPGRKRTGAWVPKWFAISGKKSATQPPGRLFIPARMSQNPHINSASYAANLKQTLDPMTFKRFVEGDWQIDDQDGIFPVDKLIFVPATSVDHSKFISTIWCFDLAASHESGDNTCAVKMGVTSERIFTVLDVRTTRGNPAEVLAFVRNIVESERLRRFALEQEPGSGGLNTQKLYRDTFAPYGCAVIAVPARGSKEDRATPFAIRMGAGEVHVVEADWNDDFTDELAMFPSRGVPDDRVDAAAGAYTMLERRAQRDEDERNIQWGVVGGMTAPSIWDDGSSR